MQGKQGHEAPKRMAADIRPPVQRSVAKKARSHAVQTLLKRRWPLAAAVVCLIVIGTLAYGYVTTKRELANVAGASAAQTETGRLTETIGKHIELPLETPTIATVEDVSKLDSQAFFKRAHNGDKVLIYAKSGRALLYRPSTQKVIEYTMVNLAAATP